MIEIKSFEEIGMMRTAGKIVREVFNVLCENTVPGKNTWELDAIAEKLICGQNARPAFKGYKGYPATICSSVNDSIVHEIPSRRTILKEGDIISYDVGVEYKGYFADAAITMGVGKISQTALKLIEVTEKSLTLGIGMTRSDKRLSDISHAVQTHVEENGFSVVRHFVGHGIGRSLHEEPEIPNAGRPHKGPRLKSGMVLAIEPMVNEGHFDIKIKNDGWTAKTKDGSLSAHFEHTVLVNGEKPEILT